MVLLVNEFNIYAAIETITLSCPLNMTKKYLEKCMQPNCLEELSTDTVIIHKFLGTILFIKEYQKTLFFRQTRQLQ